MSRQQNSSNPIQFNQNSAYNVIPTGSVRVIPYQQDRVNDEAAASSKNYSNKFFDEYVYREGDKTIKLTPDRLNDIKKENTKGKDTNANVYSQTYTSYIHVDSSQRVLTATNIYAESIYNLPPYPITFTNASSKITVSLPNNPFQINDRVILNGITSKNVILRNVVMVKKNSLFVRIFHANHGITFYGLYDPSNSEQFETVSYVEQLPPTFNESDDIPDSSNIYYIFTGNAKLDYTIGLSNIRGSDISRTLIGNIPINYLNRRQTVYLLFTKAGTTFQSDPNSYLILLDRPSSINYMDGVNYITDASGNPTSVVSDNDTYITFFNLFGIPLNYLNSGTPISISQKYPYATVTASTSNSFTVDVIYKAIIDPSPAYSFYAISDIVDEITDPLLLIGKNNGGGNQCYSRLVKDILPGFPNPNNYQYILDKTYRNIIQARIIESVFPNSQRIINNQTTDIINNKLYWRNLEDGDYIYSLFITPGNYSPSQLAAEISNAFANTIRYPYTKEYAAGIFPSIIVNSTPINNILYDSNGLYKYHIVDVSISEQTDVVSFTSYRQIIQQDTSTLRILDIPDNIVTIHSAYNFQADFSVLVNSVLCPGFSCSPFNPSNGEEMYLYLTPNSHIWISDSFPYVYYNLYRYTETVDPYPTTSAGDTTFNIELVENIALLVNFFRTKGVGNSVGGSISSPTVPAFTATGMVSMQNMVTTLMYGFIFTCPNIVITTIKIPVALWGVNSPQRTVTIWNSGGTAIFTGFIRTDDGDTNGFYTNDINLSLSAGTYTIGFENTVDFFNLIYDSYYTLGIEVFNPNLTNIITVNNGIGLGQPTIVTGANFSEYGYFDFYLGPGLTAYTGSGVGPILNAVNDRTFGFIFTCTGITITVLKIPVSLWTAAATTRQVGIWNNLGINIYTDTISNTTIIDGYYVSDVVITLAAGTYTIGFSNLLNDNYYGAVGTEYFNPALTAIQTVNSVSGFTLPLVVTGANFSEFGNFDFYSGVSSSVSTQEVNSVNTNTLLYNFDYNYYTNEVYLLSHRLNVGDLIITDQFTDPSSPNQIFVYQITSIVDADNFVVERFDHGQKFKFIYDSLIINFNSNAIIPDTAYYWLDQKTPPGPLPLGLSLSLIGITPSAENKVILRIHQPNHQLEVGDIITIANSGPINQVPQEAINTSHTIQKILDADDYEVFLNPYTPLAAPTPLTQLNIITIKYPDIFQMFFNFQDTLGNILSFNKVGQSNAITPYAQIILNTNPYANDYDFTSLGTEYQPKLTKLNMTGYNYFFIVSPELGISYRNTRPINQVFSKIRWFDDPGNVVFDSFVPSVSVYDTPISQLSSITFSMYHPDGRLVEFNNLDHSFTIEIVEVYNQPDNTDINVRINSELIVRKV